MGSLSIGKAIFIAKQICEGLSEAHRLGIIHRDLKPQNIMIDRDGNARIMDFGIARSLETSGMTDSGGVVGTAAYMSPEQVEGIPADVRSDIYSLGIILYELVIGAVPFNGNTPMSVALKRMLQVPAEPSNIDSRIPGELSKVIMTCIHKDKDKRYQSTADLLSDLNEIEAQLPSTDKVIPRGKSSTTKDITVSFKTKKILIATTTICLIAAAGILLWFLVLKPDVQTEVLLPSPKTEPVEAQSKKQEPESKPIEGAVQEKKKEIIPPAPIPETPVKKKVEDRIADSRKKTAELAQKREQEISNNLKQAQAAFDKGDFQECIDLSQKILGLNPDHAEAAEFVRLAEQEQVTTYVVNLIGQFNSAVNGQTLPEFYRKACSPDLYQQINKDVELIMNSYENLKSVTSDSSLQFVGTDHLQVSFPNITMGVLKQEGRQQVLFEGTYIWDMKKSENTWKIMNIKTSAVKKSIKKEET